MGGWRGWHAASGRWVGCGGQAAGRGQRRRRGRAAPQAVVQVLAPLRSQVDAVCRSACKALPESGALREWPQARQRRAEAPGRWRGATGTAGQPCVCSPLPQVRAHPCRTPSARRSGGPRSAGAAAGRTCSTRRRRRRRRSAEWSAHGERGMRVGLAVARDGSPHRPPPPPPPPFSRPRPPLHPSVAAPARKPATPAPSQPHAPRGKGAPRSLGADVEVGDAQQAGGALQQRDGAVHRRVPVGDHCAG